VRSWAATALGDLGTLEHLPVLTQAICGDHVSNEGESLTVSQQAIHALCGVVRRNKELSAGEREGFEIFSELKPEEGIVETLSWGDPKLGIFECRLVERSRQGEPYLWS
jgi:hypothetical protein